jgi:hypothetical protein
MPEQYKIGVNVNDKLSVQRNTISGLVLLSNTLRKKPVQNRKIDVHGLELPTIKLQIVNVQAVFEFIELDKLAVAKHDSKMLSAKVPQPWKHEGYVQVEPFNFALREQVLKPMRKTLLLKLKKSLSIHHSSKVERVKLK